MIRLIGTSSSILNLGLAIRNNSLGDLVWSPARYSRRIDALVSSTSSIRSSGCAHQPVPMTFPERAMNPLAPVSSRSP